MKKLLLLSLVLVGCMKVEQDPRDIHGVDPAFNDYIAEFEAILGHSIGDIPIQFATLCQSNSQGGCTIGECMVWDSQWREIKIDPSYWFNPANSGSRKSTIFHEFGHCVLDRGHLNGVDSTGHFISWMNSFIFFNIAGYESYSYDEQHYLDELFHPAPGFPTLSQSSGATEANDEEDFIHINTKDNK